MPSAPVSVTNRIALRLVQLGTIAIVLASLPYKPFDLDRYFVPKELVLHTCALLAALFCLVGRDGDGRIRVSFVDGLLLGFLALSAASAAMAPNLWLAQRAISISLSGVALFWVARALARSGLRRGLVSAAALAVVVGASTALLQAYGIKSQYFSLNRAPGGTFGNRNFVAHLCAIGVPALAYLVLTARRGSAALAAAIGLALTASALVLSRTRAAWLAVVAVALVVAALAVVARRPWWPHAASRRLLLIAAGAGVGVLAAVALPNTLDWNSESPYLDSAAGLVNYKEGSGRGRLVQYETSLKILRAHPVWGVGPGNWPVAYPAYAGRGDPSLSGDEGMTANPWPSSDWVATLSERGLIAVGLLACALLALLWAALASLRAPRPLGYNADGALASLALAGTIVAGVVAGSFDAVLLIAVPSFLFWTLAGALAPDADVARWDLPRSTRAIGIVLVLIAGAVAIIRSARQVGAMSVFTASSRASALERASQLDPGSYRIQMRVADAYAAQGSCAKARAHAEEAQALFPSAVAPKRVLARCGR